MGAPVAAQEIQVPDGCAAFLTVQSKECSVSIYWRCAAAPEGHTYLASYDGGGPVSVSLFDREFQWLDKQSVTLATREYLLSAEDPASLSDLLETGRDTYDFVIREEAPDATMDTRHVGFDELSGETVTIDGQELLVTLFSSRATNAETGEEIYSVAGQQYVSAEDRLFFLGRDTFQANGRQRTSDGSPVHFYRPGDAGFAQSRPLYDCEAPTDISLER